MTEYTLHIINKSNAEMLNYIILHNCITIYSNKSMNDPMLGTISLSNIPVCTCTTN